MADYFAVVEMLVKNSEPISKNRPRKLASGHMQLLSKIDSMVKASSGRGKNSYLLKYFKNNDLSTEEKLAVAFICYKQANAWEIVAMEDIYTFISGGDRVKMLSLPNMFNTGSRLMKAGIIKKASTRDFGQYQGYELGLKAKNSLFYCNYKDNKGPSPEFDREFGERSPVSDKPAYKMPYASPRDIYHELSKYVIGQDQAKYKLSVAAYSHCLRISGKSNVKKANIFLSGPTGSGKTFLIEMLSKLINVPVFIADATHYSETGYVGNNVEDILTGLYLAAGKNPYVAERGMIFIDEVDKVAASYDSGKHNSNRDVSGASVQEELLKVLEGGSFPSRLFDTSNVLFIVGGAFSGLAGQSEIKRAIGFGRSENSSETRRKAQIGIDGYVKYGMLPEFMGRFPIQVHFDALRTDSLRKILTEPENSLITQYRDLFGSMGVSLVMDDAVLDLIAEKAAGMKTGARALKSVVEDVFSPLMYEYFGSDSKGRKVVISPEMINA